MKVVIIGGDAAGMSAAMEIVREHKEAQIVVLEKGTVYSYGQCGLPYVIDGRVSKSEDVIARPVEQFREKYNIDARVLHEVTTLDEREKFVAGINLATNETFKEYYDKLLIATGASPVALQVTGHELSGIYFVKTVPEMNYLMRDLAQVKRVTVIGGGYIGLEVAEALRLRNLDVTLIQRSKQFMPALNNEFAQLVFAEALKHGIKARLEESLIAFEGEESVTTVVTDKGRYETDLVIVAAGIVPNTQFADGFKKLSNGALIVDEYQQTSYQDIYAAGDCASHFHRLKNEPDFLSLGTTANKQGRVAGRVIAGKSAKFAGIVGTSMLQFFDLEIGMTGLTLRDTTKLGLQVDVYNWEANAVASYYKTPPKLKLQMIVEKGSERLLGLQMIGEKGVDKRIDVFATALYNEMTLSQLIDIDISYSPPFNGVWDALLQVAKRYT